MLSSNSYHAWRKRISEIIEVAKPEDKTSRAYDLLNMLTIVINLIVSVAYTFESMRKTYGPLFVTLEGITVAFLRWIMCCAFLQQKFAINSFLNSGQR